MLVAIVMQTDQMCGGSRRPAVSCPVVNTHKLCVQIVHFFPSSWIFSQMASFSWTVRICCPPPNRRTIIGIGFYIFESSHVLQKKNQFHGRKRWTSRQDNRGTYRHNGCRALCRRSVMRGHAPKGRLHHFYRPKSENRTNPLPNLINFFCFVVVLVLFWFIYFNCVCRPWIGCIIIILGSQDERW